MGFLEGDLDYAVEFCEARTGVPAPFKGEPGKPDPFLERQVKQDLADHLGHSRTHIVGCYIGSRSQPRPQQGEPEIPADGLDQPSGVTTQPTGQASS